MSIQFHRKVDSSFDKFHFPSTTWFKKLWTSNFGKMSSLLELSSLRLQKAAITAKICLVEISNRKPFAIIQFLKLFLVLVRSQKKHGHQYGRAYCHLISKCFDVQILNFDNNSSRFGCQNYLSLEMFP